MDMTLGQSPLLAADPILDTIEIPDISQIAFDIGGFFTAFSGNLSAQLSSATIWLQVAGIVVSAFLGYLLTRLIKAAIGPFLSDFSEGFRDGTYDHALRIVVLPTACATLLWLTIAALSQRGLPVDFMRIVGAILVAAIITGMFASTRKDRFWKYTVAAFAWTGAGLVTLRLLEPFLAFIDSLVVPFGDDLSLLDVLKTAFAGIALIWAASLLARLIETRMRNSTSMAPSVRGLFSQLVRIALIGAAVVMALALIGIDLTAFAVFSGALGVGIGFGLQSIFSNLVAGIIIILEKTLKVGDFVDLEGGITGEVQEINVRSTLVRTNDNIDMLIPNSEFINKRVINWTLREAKRRMHVAVGVAYGSDKELVRKALLEAAANVEFTLKDNERREPDVWLINFGDSSLDFELIVWLTDEATKKPARVHAAYCWEIETQLAKYGITIPFPQRDLHIIKPAGLEEE